MTESLNVIALISGGKDSFFSILHCIRHGHNIVALANLYPTLGSKGSDKDEHDQNSFMYQTVGHTVVPLYEQALQIPLYRQPIIGGAVQTAASYSPAKTRDADGDADGDADEAQDETESLVPLLKKIITNHPIANSISTGAILSTYQRTRVESVALRLGLIPLGFLWKYPILPPGTQTSLLEDMQTVDLDARIIKVASGGLDEDFLWANVASRAAIGKLEKSMKRFGTDGDGSVLGEGGEFETLVIDGPNSLFKGRIEIQEGARRVVREGGGSVWLQILDSKVVMKNCIEATEPSCRIPDLFSQRFNKVLATLRTKVATQIQNARSAESATTNPIRKMTSPSPAQTEDMLYWKFAPDTSNSEISVFEEATSLISEIRQRLESSNLQPSDIVFTTIVLRSMTDFALVNKIYGSLFINPNPPARVTISCGSLLPSHLVIYLTLSASRPRKALHVQSRSYWAPANIGPYSQAISTCLSPVLSSESSSETWAVSTAGQIPLIPHTMTLPPHDDFELQAVLALQHLWRIGEEMHVSWWTSAVAYLPRAPSELNRERAVLAGHAWELLHERKDEDIDEDEEERDLWEEKHFAGMERRGAKTAMRKLPDWDVVMGGGQPPFWAVEVEELPRGSGVEWHAHLGVVNGNVELASTIHHEGWTINQCAFGGHLHTILMVPFSISSSDVVASLDHALSAIGVEVTRCRIGYTSYIDIMIDGLWDSNRYRGSIPCRSIWNASGQKLGAVVLLDEQ